MYKFSFITCVNDFDKYAKCVQESLAAERESGKCELIAIDNVVNKFSVPEALNKGIDQASGGMLVCCHQDVYFEPGWIRRVEQQIKKIEANQSLWGVLGTFGVDTDGYPSGHIIDQDILYETDNLPCKVQSLDEHCLIFRKSEGFRFDESALGGFHLYGADICLHAQSLGYTNYAIDSCLHHKAAGKKLDESFYSSMEKLSKKWKKLDCPLNVVETTCAVIKLKPTMQAWIEYLRIKKQRRKRRGRKKSVFSTLDFESKPKGYFGAIRSEMLDFIQSHPQKTLEFGCGDGGFSAVVSERFKSEAWAVELDPQAAATAATKLFKVVCADAGKAFDELPEQYFDHVFLIDFIEHLVDPYSFLRQLKSKMSDSGVIIASIPNIRYYRTVIEYLVHGQWDYRNAGTLDITHLRFFTCKSMLNMFNELGFRVHKIEGVNKSRNRKLQFFNKLLFGKIGDMAYLQYAVVASPVRNVHL